jgi:uncharacterized protein (TIGR02246 family)
VRLSEQAEQIGRAFQRRYETLWNSSGAVAVAELYTDDGILVTARGIASGREEIATALDAFFQRGWTTISINVLHIPEAAGTVLVVSEFTAFGSGTKEGETLSGKSSHVLTQTGGEWRSVMHGVM